MTEYEYQLINQTLDKITSEMARRGDQKSNLNLQLAQNMVLGVQTDLADKKNQMINLGLELPEQDKSANFQHFIDNSGDTDTMNVMGSMYGQALQMKNMVDESLTMYNQGRREAKTLLAEGAGRRAFYGDEISPDAPYESYSDYRLDAPEIEALGARGTISEEDYTNQYYMAGFDEGNRSQEDAMNIMLADQKLQQSTLALHAGKLEFAKQANDEGVVSMGAVIGNNMITTGIPEALGLKGILGVEGGAGQFSSVIQTITKKGEFPNIQAEIIKALNDFADPSLTPADQLRGFTTMSGNAHETFQIVNSIEAQAISSGFFGANVDPLVGLTDDQINQLRSSNENYNLAYTKLLEYAAVGIPVNNQKLLQQTYMSNEISSNIISSKNKIVRGEMDKLSQDLGISSDYLYENTEWIPEENWDVTAAQLQAQEAEEAAITGSLDLPTMEEGEWSEIVQLGKEMKTRREESETAYFNIRNDLRAIYKNVSVKKVMSEEGLDVDQVPNKEQLDKLKSALEADIKRALDPKTQTAFGNVPLLGLLAPEQGVEGVVDNASYVTDLQNVWTNLITNWEIHQELTGKTKTELSDRYKKLFISQ